LPASATPEPLAVFVNPSAGGGRARKTARAAEARFARARFPTVFHEPRTPEAYSEAVRREVARGARAVAALGGDGTLQRMAREVLGRALTVGILPAGGGNDFAKALGIASLESAVDAVIAGGRRRVDAVRVRTAVAEGIYLGGGGVGLDARAARFARGGLRLLPGRVRYLCSALLALVGFRGVSVRAEFPGSDLPALEETALLAAVLNTPGYGGGVRLAPEAQIDDGLLELVVIEPLSNWEALGLLPRLLLEGTLKGPRVVRRRAGKIRLAAPGERLHGDGEWFGEGPFEIEVLPGALEMYAP